MMSVFSNQGSFSASDRNSPSLSPCNGQNYNNYGGLDSPILIRIQLGLQMDDDL